MRQLWICDIHGEIEAIRLPRDMTDVILKDFPDWVPWPFLRRTAMTKKLTTKFGEFLVCEKCLEEVCEEVLG